LFVWSGRVGGWAKLGKSVISGVKVRLLKFSSGNFKNSRLTQAPPALLLTAVTAC
jgi:hypothetical protein